MSLIPDLIKDKGIEANKKGAKDSWFWSFTNNF